MTLYNIVLKEKKWKLTTISVEKYYTFEPGSLRRLSYKKISSI